MAQRSIEQLNDFVQHVVADPLVKDDKLPKDHTAWAYCLTEGFYLKTEDVGGKYVELIAIVRSLQGEMRELIQLILTSDTGRKVERSNEELLEMMRALDAVYNRESDFYPYENINPYQVGGVLFDPFLMKQLLRHQDEKRKIAPLVQLYRKETRFAEELIHSCIDEYKKARERISAFEDGNETDANPMGYTLEPEEPEDDNESCND